MKTQENLPLFRGELALLLAVLVNSFGVVLMLYSGAGMKKSADGKISGDGRTSAVF